MERHLSLRLEELPDLDQSLWATTLAPAESLFDDGGAADRLSEAALRFYLEAYLVWSSFLARTGLLDPQVPPSRRVTPERLQGWVADQRSRANRDSVIYGRFRGLFAALKLMEPEAELDFIIRPAGRSLRKVFPPVPKWTEVRDSRELLDRALALFEAGQRGEGYAEGRAAVRDAALLGLLVLPAPRIGATARMQIGTHIRRTAGGYQVYFGEADTKTREPQWYDLLPDLVPVFDHYIVHTRASWGIGAESGMLWVGTKNKELSGRDLGKIVRRRTEEWFGRAFGPHWFRKCLRTTIALVAPELALDASITLGHTVETSLRNYDKAKTIMALKRHGEHIAAMRAACRARAAEAFGWNRGRSALEFNLPWEACP